MRYEVLKIRTFFRAHPVYLYTIIFRNKVFVEKCNVHGIYPSFFVCFQFIFSGLVKISSYWKLIYAHCACRIQAWDPKFNVPSEGRRGELWGQASEVTHPESDLTRPGLTSVTRRRLYKPLGRSPRRHRNPINKSLYLSKHIAIALWETDLNQYIWISSYPVLFVVLKFTNEGLLKFSYFRILKHFVSEGQVTCSRIFFKTYVQFQFWCLEEWLLPSGITRHKKLFWPCLSRSIKSWYHPGIFGYSRWWATIVVFLLQRATY